MRRRIVITGFGCVTPLGAEPETFWSRLIEGRSAVGPISLFDASNFPVRIAAEVQNEDMSAIDGLAQLGPDHSRQTKFAVAAAMSAARRSCLTSSRIDPLRVGVYLGCGEVYPDFIHFAKVVGNSFSGETFDQSRFYREYCAASQPGNSLNGSARGSNSNNGASLSGDHLSSDSLNLEPDVPVGLISGLLDAQGPSANYTTACVSSSVAIGEAAEVIRRDGADVMLAGGAHSMIHPFGITGFHRLSTLSTRNEAPEQAYRPFDRDRDGFVVGEGGAVVVLEELEHARRRGAEIWAELRGYGTSHDAFRVTDPEPSGAAAARCMSLAIDDARISPEDIDYINAHGSGTILNDKAETAAVKKALGPWAHKTPISGTKSMTGHWTTACGAIEFLICVMAISRGVVPPTINYETPDPDCDLDYVPNVAREVDCRNALTSNFGFGGHNASLLVSRYTAD